MEKTIIIAKGLILMVMIALVFLLMRTDPLWILALLFTAFLMCGFAFVIGWIATKTFWRD